MKVGVWAPELGAEVGGGYTYQRDIVDAVAALGPNPRHQFAVIGLSAEAPPGVDAQTYISVAPRRNLRFRDRLGRRLRAMFEDREAAFLRSADVLFAENALDLVWCVTAGAPTRALPYVTTVLDLQHRRQPIFPEVFADGEWDRRERLFYRELRGAAAVIVGNASGQAEVETFYGVLADSIRWLPHPTPAFALGDLSAQTDVLARFRLDPGYVFYPAQFWAHKNHAGLLQGIAILRDEHGITLNVVFVGSDKGSQAHVETVARTLGLEDQVQFLGFVSRDDLATLYRNAFALTYVSFFGPENLPPLEAFAFGCPVVASDVPGAREQLGDAALLAPPSDASALADALRALHVDAELRRNLISKGRERALQQTPTTYVAGMLSVLDELEPMIRTWR